MMNATDLRPIQASLEEAVSYLASGLWDCFPDLAPWDMEDANDLLRKLAHRGLVQLTGSPRHGVGPIGDRCDIPASFFLDPVEFEHEFHRITAIDDHPRWGHSYVEVQVSAQSLMDAATQPLPNPTINVTIADETACKKWLVSIMHDSPKHRTMAKEKAMVTWRQMGRNISDKAFERAWSLAISEANAPAWSLAGRPKKNPAR
jgi:hypothetical protein